MEAGIVTTVPAVPSFAHKAFETDIQDQISQILNIMKLPSVSGKYPILILRIIMGVIFVTHGAARLFYNSIADFGAFLDSQGFIFGLFLAWTVTIGELVFGSLLAIGHKVRYAVIFHAIVVVMGILLIHIPQGWFLVGHGNGGTEYSLLILAVLFLLYSKSSE